MKLQLLLILIENEIEIPLKIKCGRHFFFLLYILTQLPKSVYIELSSLILDFIRKLCYNIIKVEKERFARPLRGRVNNNQLSARRCAARSKLIIINIGIFIIIKKVIHFFGRYIGGGVIFQKSVRLFLLI